MSTTSAAYRPSPHSGAAHLHPAHPHALHPTVLRPGATPGRPPRGKSQAHPGVHPVSAFSHRTQKFQPLPNPLAEPPYRIDLEAILPGINASAASAGRIVFHCVGDTGGVKSPDSQRAVAAAMKGDLLDAAAAPSFFYHLGDVVYYNGQIDDYYDQFYEPYENYTPPIIAIPGNHDGDPIDASQTSLDGWVRYFMSPTPHVNPESHDAPRVTQSLPNVYFTLRCPFATIVGMYTNVPEHGSIDSVQQQWLTNEFKEAPTDRALILALHHPVYSFDDHHSGSPRMADAVQHAINDTRRVPNLVLTAHVHNYQRIEKVIAGEKPTPFLVAGNGGYYHLHGMNAAAGHSDPDTGANLIFENHKLHGYLTLTVNSQKISGSATLVDAKTQSIQRGVDPFSYPTAAITLPAGQVVSL